MSSLTAVKSAIDLLDWKSADMAEIKSVVDDILDSMDADLEEVAFDESSVTEQLYGKLRKLLDAEDLKLLQEEEEAEDEEPENGEEDDLEEVEELLEGDDDEEEDDIEFEDDEEVETPESPTKE